MNSLQKKYYPSKSKNDTTSTGVLFEARSFYQKYTIPFSFESNSNVVVADEVSGVSATTPESLRENYIPSSDLYRQNSLYGILDLDGDVTIPIADMSNFKSVGFDNKNNPIYLQNFIADAFNDMSKYLNEQVLGKCVSLSSIPEEIRNSPFFNISVKKAYSKSSDIDNLYFNNANIISSKFRALCLDNKSLDSQINNISNFTKKYVDFVREHLIISPITKSRTACFYNLKTFSSGLVFSISNDDAGDDENKYTTYLLDKSFHNFAKACIRFGFRIDKNSPFILHCDLASPALKPYYEKYGLKSIQDIFSKRYKKVYLDDLESLKFFFIDSYDSFLYNNTFYYPNLNNFCTGRSKNISMLTRNPPDEEEIKEYLIKHSDMFWMRLYIYYKCLELNLNIEQKQFEDIVKKANNYIKFGKPELGLKFANGIFNEFTGVHFFSSLQSKNEVVQQEVRNGKGQLIF